MTREDLVAVGMEAVWKVLEQYPDASNRFINNKVSWAMMDAIRGWRTKRKDLPKVEHIEETDAAQLFDPKTLPDGTAYKRERMKRLKAAIAKLPKRQRVVIERRLRGDLADDIAKDFGVTQARITQIMTEAIGVLRKMPELREYGDSSLPPPNPDDVSDSDPDDS